MKRLICISVTILALAGCSSGTGESSQDGTKPPASSAPATASITVTSSAFAAGADIPVKYSCKGENISPPLQWSGVPKEATSLALVVDDPDAPNPPYVHWVVLNIDPAATEVAEGAVPAKGTQLKGSNGQAAYAGMCPPGQRHRYVFKVYALKEPLQNAETQSPVEIGKSLDQNAIAKGELTGSFQPS
ncbi:YbhB/YbcL family Raf kinase inhibitor-like protein [Rhizohabitans arisaemae]|uniref:YbhB/YbcL family Raf kinase inhibitor-like protein n=1 Tax=Rhizohabitans arisaemae TaxID=2720610 RepID=UPI0024B2386F|nr:YbhB/YbcL family Raf kinase inhibitor-like protein [Rhizohabitans arisaemae]